MKFSRKTILKFGLPLVLAVSAFSGSIAQADDGQSPTPPTATSVALNTYGSLPVVVLNLTQSPINLNLSTNSSAYGQSLPLAAGLPGVYYPNNGSTSTFTNIVNPSTAVNGTTSASLMPISTTVAASNVTTFSNDYSWMSLFTVFPSWTQPSGLYEYVQYVALSNVNNVGAAANSYNVLAGYPSGNAKNITKINPQSPNGCDYTNASALTTKGSVVTSMNLNLMDTSGAAAATYKININSLGGGTTGGVPIPQTGFSILKAMHSVLNIVTDIAVTASGDPLGIIDFIAGIPATIKGIATDITNNSNNVNSNVTTDVAYPATNKGINVTATATFNGASAQLTAISGDSQSLMYEVQAGANQTIPLMQQNAVFVTTWRQSPGNNYGVTLPNAADTLFVTVLNQGVATSNKMQQHINKPANAQIAGGAKYNPTKEQAQDSAKILEILNAISKKNPQDVKAIVDIFGISGKYDQIKNDPNQMKTLNVELKTIFEKHRTDLPAIEQYLTKLAQK